jgi:acetylornithine/LysW-gamma-L-lysine aminotransferase
LSDDWIIRTEDAHLAGVYQKFPVSIVRGRGALVYDSDGREYIDCMGGYGVSLVGHCHPRVVEAIRRQSETLITCHGSFYNDQRAELLEKLVKISPKGLEKVFLCNSGTEAVECALKAALKYTGRSEIISTVRGFHGKTAGSLSATWNPKYRRPFEPLISKNFKFIPYGRLEKAEEAITEKTAAVIVEPIQGEGGVHVPPDGYLEGLREICEDRGVALIFDEVQTGFGRTGRMWASQHWNVTPDIMCVAKAMGGGLPIGATIGKAEIINSLKTGEHTSTFGGNPLACAAACATIDVILEENLCERAESLGRCFKRLLQRMVDEFRVLREVRGLGLMIGLESRLFVHRVLMRALSEGLILLYSGRNVIRFLPPLVIESGQLARAAEILEGIFADEEKALKEAGETPSTCMKPSQP